MKLSIFVKVLIAAVLPLVLSLSLSAVAINKTIEQTVRAEAENTVLYKTLYAKAVVELQLIALQDATDSVIPDVINENSGLNFSSPFEEESGVNLLLIAEDGEIFYAVNPEFTGKNISSLVLENNSIQPVGRFSEFMYYHGTAFIDEYNSVFSGEKSYFGMTPVYYSFPNEHFYVFIDIPSALLLAPYTAVTRTFVYLGAAGIILAVLGAVLVTKILNDSLKQARASTEETARREHEVLSENLKTALEKEKLNVSRNAETAYINNVSHKIRTSMNSILGLTQVLLIEEQRSPLSETQKKYISNIKFSADSLFCTINDILDLSDLTSGKMTLSPRDYNFVQLIDGVSSLARFMTESKKLEYKFSIAGELPTCLYGDDARLRRVLINIIGNSVMFTEKGFISFKVIINSDKISFEIRDSGKGIKPERMPNLFDEFNQSEKSDAETRTANTDNITVLGLPISKKLIDLMKGDISVDSQRGIGSVFMVTIPQIPGDKNNLKVKAIDSNMYFSKDTRALVVDDNEINLQMTEGLVSTLYGIKCDIAVSGREALTLAEKNKYDIIFMDRAMPEMDGVKTMKLIRELGGVYANLPIIALTADADTGTREYLIEQGMNDFLAKPIMIDQLGDILQRWIPKEKRRS
ncbi:MAG: response regulator [Oscillospiraceae bacterium]|nr:response regulator [Oscillospiraceae bacterium]